MDRFQAVNRLNAFKNRIGLSYQSSIFGAVQKVYPEKDWDAINDMYVKMNSKTGKGEAMDDVFKEEKGRKAYLYMVFPAYTWTLSHVWDEICDLFIIETPFISFCSINGGPGAEIFALKLFLERHKNYQVVKGTILEKHTNWNQEHQELLKELAFGSVETMYKKFDFEDVEVPESCKEAVRRSHLVTATGVVSRYSHLPNFNLKFKELLMAMEVNTSLLFIDSCNECYRNIMESIASSAGLEKIYENTNLDDCFIPKAETREMLQFCNEHEVPIQPRPKITVCVMLWQKPPPPPTDSCVVA